MSTATHLLTHSMQDSWSHIFKLYLSSAEFIQGLFVNMTPWTPPLHWLDFWLTRPQVGVIWEREPQLRKCFIWLACGQDCGICTWSMSGLGGPSSLWAVPFLPRLLLVRMCYHRIETLRHPVLPVHCVYSTIYPSWTDAIYDSVRSESPPHTVTGHHVLPSSWAALHHCQGTEAVSLPGEHHCYFSPVRWDEEIDGPPHSGPPPLATYLFSSA